MLEALCTMKTPRGRRAPWLALTVVSAMLAVAACDGGEQTGSSGNGGHSSSTTSSATSGAGGGSGGGMSGHTWTMGPAFDTAAPPFSAVEHPLAPTALWGSVTAPYPTNAEWENLVLKAGTNPVNMLPYVVNATATGLDVSLPKRTVDAKSITSAVEHDLSFRALEPLTGHAVTAHDLLSVTMKWSGDPNQSITTPLVRGMPYVTAVYAGLTPLIASSHAILKINGAMAGPATGDKFVIELNNGQTWVLYAPSSVAINWNALGISFGATLTGPLRVALLGSAADAMDVLDKYKGTYPTGGDVGATVTGDTATVSFSWSKQGNGELLMMALPHHMDALKAPVATDLTLGSIKGDMTAIAGDVWTMTEPLSTITWSSPTPIAADKMADVKAALAADAKAMPNVSDPYGFGKQIAKLGRLALIADDLADDATAKSIREQMKASIDPWLTGMNTDALMYDKTYGGICSKLGLSDSSKDFGQGYYNDHHFHYGYFLYAAAALAKADSAWFASRKDAIVALARDIANPSTLDSSFTRFRNKDWFTGHSWAAGLFEFGDSRNQESTSEAVNAWYGLTLLGLAAGDENLTNVGRVLLATEIRSVQKYWHIRKGSAIYGAPFADNTVVGVLWSTKADYSTFFCGNVECIHGIQMIPFTPISEALLEPDWVAEEYPVLSAGLSPMSQDSWRGFAYMDHAILDPAMAWDEVKMLNGFDDGNSLTNALTWVATRPTK